MKMNLKLCLACQKELPVDNFYKRDGRCKPCRLEYRKMMWDKSPDAREATKVRSKTYYRENSEMLSKRRREAPNNTLHSRLMRCLGNSKASNKRGGFNLDIDFLKDLYAKQCGKCALSGEELEISGDRYLSNLLSIDRVDSSVGYVKGNVQLVGVQYNMMKAHATQDQFIQMCKTVVENHTCD